MMEHEEPSYEDWGKLYGAARDGDIHRVEQYLDEGWDINQIYPPLTSLAIAVTHEHWDIVTLLLERGADPNVHEENETTPLCLAVTRRSYGVVRQLLKYGADPNLKGDYYGDETPLSNAIRLRDAEMVALLLLHGADPTRADVERCPDAPELFERVGDRSTALEVAIKVGDELILDILRNAGVRIEDAV